jgi:hypothetical protein
VGGLERFQSYRRRQCSSLPKPHAAIGRFLDWIDEIETRAASVKPTQFPLSAPDIEVIRAAYERMKQSDPEKPEE